MPRGDKSKYTNKQKRQAEHIEESYKKRGTSDESAERIAWSTVNKESGGGKKGGSGSKKKTSSTKKRTNRKKPTPTRSRSTSKSVKKRGSSSSTAS